MSVATSQTIDHDVRDKRERLPALACVFVWFTTAGGCWAALLSLALR